MTEAELAEHHYKLGRILWTMGGNMRDDPTMARAHFEAASKEECDSQVGASLSSYVCVLVAASSALSDQCCDTSAREHAVDQTRHVPSISAWEHAGSDYCMYL